MSSFDKTETNETRYVGGLTPEELRTVIKDAVMDVVGLRQWESGVSLTFVVEGVPEAPHVRFTLVHDHHFYRKEAALAAAKETPAAEAGDEVR